MANEPPKEEKLKDLLVLYMFSLRACTDFESDGSLAWEKGGTLPAWKRGPYWHEIGKKNCFRLEKLIQQYLTKHYPMWDSIHGDVENVLNSNKKDR